MLFDVTCAVLKSCTENPPSTEEMWLGSWNAILSQLFPPTDDYLITPQCRLSDDPDNRIPHFIFDVAQLSIPRTVLVVEFKNTTHWPAGSPALKRQLSWTAASFVEPSHAKIYWIEIIGPHWRYGEKTDGQELQPLIDWHDVTHDEASFRDLQELASLVAAL